MHPADPRFTVLQTSLQYPAVLIVDKESQMYKMIWGPYSVCTCCNFSSVWSGQYVVVHVIVKTYFLNGKSKEEFSSYCRNIVINIDCIHGKCLPIKDYSL